MLTSVMNRFSNILAMLTNNQTTGRSVVNARWTGEKEMLSEYGSGMGSFSRKVGCHAEIQGYDTRLISGSEWKSSLR